MKVVDHILDGKVHNWLPHSMSESAAVLLRNARSPCVIDISSVELLLRNSITSGDGFHLLDHVDSTPMLLPFSRVLFSFGRPSSVDGGKSEMGVLCWNQDNIPGIASLGLPEETMCFGGICVEYIQNFGSLVRGTASLALSSDFFPVARDRSRSDWQSFASIIPSQPPVTNGALLEDFKRESAKSIQISLAVVFLAMSLLNCKNVSAVEQPCSPKLERRYLERHGHRRPRYYVLDIQPMKQIIRKESGGEPVTLAKALHICRGHFKNFDDKPLFGKLKGTYWWQPHVRGTAEAGVVEKDYRIKLPTGAKS